MKHLPIVLATLALAFTARAASVTPHSLVTCADDQQYWLARVEHFNNADYTFLDFRLLGQDDRWQRLCRFDSAVDDLAAQGSTAGVLLRDKSWSIVYSSGIVVSGGPLPAGAKMVALGAGPHSWWAVGQTPGGLRAALAATQPATEPTTTTQPATATASRASNKPANPNPAPVLFQLAAADWTPVAELPNPSAEGAHVALALVNQVPYVALHQASALDVYHLENGRWITDFHSENFPQVAAFKFLIDSGPPRLWIQNQTGPDSLISLKGAAPVPTPLNVSTDAPAKDRDAVIFGKSIRVVSRFGARLTEQRFNSDTLKPEDKPVELLLPETTQLIDLQGLHTLVAVVSLMLVLLGWFRQQAATEGVEPNLQNVTIAPVARRFLAGMIDAFPVIFAVTYYLAHYAALPTSVPQSRQFLFFAFYWSGGLLYILHTTLIETYTGRTLGKIMLGLKVVTLQGTPPDQPSLIIRNTLRVFDLSLFFFPVIFIPFAPLRQRSGDLVAGTVVVLDAPRETKDTKPED